MAERDNDCNMRLVKKCLRLTLDSSPEYKGHMFDRWYADILREKLTRPYVHLIFGARQTGKSALLRALLPSESARAEWTTIRVPLD